VCHLTLRKLLLLAALTTLTACGGTGSDAPAPVAAPQAPALGVAIGLKQLRFTWSPASGVDTYRLVEDASGAGSFTQISGALGATTTSYDRDIAVHALDWPRAQYALSACNAGGCNQSAALSVKDQSASAVGYVKASDTNRNDLFGWGSAVSSDGSTLAVAAPGWHASAGSVYVFVRESSVWKQQAQLQGRSTEAGDRLGESLALSANGNTLIVGAPLEDSAATGVNGDQQSNASPSSGAVYVFVRAGSSWSQEAFLKASNTDPGDNFGFSVAVSADGNTLAAGAPLEDSGTTRVNGAEKANNAIDAGAAYVFARTGSTWSQQAYIKAPNTDPGDWLGYALALSGDGNTLAVGAPLEDSVWS
jgi:hypothetical protein